MLKNIYTIKIKNYLLPLTFLFFTFALVIFSNNNFNAAKSGLLLWANSVVPALFPFFIATELLCQTNIIKSLGNVFNIFMKPLFNIKGEGSFAFIMGIISGYPVGAKIATNFRKNEICTKEECERLLSFTNNSGPLFIIGTVGIGMFGASIIGILLFITHILASITVGIIFRFWKKTASNYNISTNNNYHLKPKNKSINFLSLGEILGNSITSAISTILIIGGFIVLFSVIISILQSSHILIFFTIIFTPLLNILNIPSDFASAFITGFLEITNGINLVSGIHIKAISLNIIITAFLLGFGGISVMLQVLSIISKTDLSIKPYIIGKLLHGIIAMFYTYLFINIFPFFNFDL